jgi:5-methylcytosine-specific restriction endonuclease McrA
MKASLAAAAAGYRERSLKLHGPVCARCGRDFSGKNLKLLTVHHKDGDPANNPPDGSNWENLCVYCHDAEHSRELLGDYENGRSKAVDNTRLVHGEEKPALGSFADLLAKAKKK